MIQWLYFPKSERPTPVVRSVVEVFEGAVKEIHSQSHEGQTSNEALRLLADGLRSIGFDVERGRKKGEKIPVTVPFGLNGRTEKTFDVDAYHEKEGFVLEIEAGRGVVNNQFLKDLFQACMMHGVFYLAIAVRNDYRGGNDFESVKTFFETLYASRRLELPLKGILLIGY